MKGCLPIILDQLKIQVVSVSRKACVHLQILVFQLLLIVSLITMYSKLQTIHTTVKPSIWWTIRFTSMLSLNGTYVYLFLTMNFFLKKDLNWYTYILGGCKILKLTFNYYPVYECPTSYILVFLVSYKCKNVRTKYYLIGIIS